MSPTEGEPHAQDDAVRLETGKKPALGVSPSDFILEEPEEESEVEKTDEVELSDRGEDRGVMSEPHEAIKDQHNVTVIDSILQKHTSDTQPGETADGVFDFGAVDYGHDSREHDGMSDSDLGASCMAAATSLDTSMTREGDTAMQTAVSVESVDRTESASLDSEDLEEPYGDQHAELAEEMQVHIAPSPQPPQLPRQASGEGEVESDDEAAPNTSAEPAAMPLRTDLKLEIRTDDRLPEARPEPSGVGMLKKMESLSSEDIVKTSSSSDTSAEPTLLAATYDLESGAISRVVATYDISPDSVEKTLIAASQPKAVLSSPEDEVFEFDTGEVKEKDAPASGDSSVCEAAEGTEDSTACKMAEAEHEETREIQVIDSEDEVSDDHIICQITEAELEETCEPQALDGAQAVAEDSDLMTEAELQAVGGVTEIDNEDTGAARAPSPFEIVSYEDVSDYSGCVAQEPPVSPESPHQHVTFEPSIPTAPAVSPNDQSRKPKLSLVEEESPSFEHSSPISSSEPSDFHGPISPFDIQTLEQLPDVSTDAEAAAAQAVAAEEPEDGGHEPDKPEERAYIYTNGPTEVDYFPEQDMLFQLHAQPHYPQEPAAPVDVDSLMLDAEEHSSSETEIQPESEEGEPQDDAASVVLLQQVLDVAQPEEGFAPEEQSFFTESLREDMPAPEFDRMMSSDHTLYGLEMPTDETGAQGTQACSSVAAAESVTSQDRSVFETHEESDDYEVPVATRQTSVSGKAALESEAMAHIFTGPVDVDTPPGYECSPAMEDREAPLLESEHRSMSLEEELAQSQLEETDAPVSESDSMKGVNIEETPEPELVALTEETADDMAASRVHFTPVQTGDSGECTDQQQGDEATNQFELHVDVWDIERPRSPLPDDSCTFWDDKDADEDLPEDEPRSEGTNELEQSLRDTAAEFVDTVLKEAQCAIVSEQHQLAEAMDDEETGTPSERCEAESPVAVELSQIGKQVSDDIPEITVTQHLYEEMQEEDDTPYATGRNDDQVEMTSDDTPDDGEQQHKEGDLMGFEDDFVVESAQELEPAETEVHVDVQDNVEVRQTDAEEVEMAEGAESQLDEEKSYDETPFLEVDSEAKPDDDASKSVEDEQNGTNPFLEFSHTPLDEKGSERLGEEDGQKEEKQKEAGKDELKDEEQKDEEQKGSDPFLVKGLDARMPKEIGDSPGGDSSCSSDSDNENISDEEGGEEMEVDTELFVNIGYGMSELATIEEERSSIESGTTSSSSHNERMLPETPEETEQQPSLLRDDKLQGSPSPVHSGVSETDSDQTSSADTCTVISSVMPEDQGDSSSVDSFATVVNADQIEAYADDRLKEIASMTSSFTSDLQGSFHEDLVPEPAISIDVRDKPSDIACELDDHSPCTEKPDVLEVSRGESLTMKVHPAEKDIVPTRDEFRPLRSKALTIKTPAHRDLRAYDRAESGKSSSSSSSERLESAAESPGISGQFFNKSSERDDISISSSLLEFECLEQAVQDRGSLEMFPPHALSPPQQPSSYNSKIGEKDNISLSSSLAEFEHLECLIAPSDSPHKKLTPTKESSSLGSITSLNEFENLEGACQAQPTTEKQEALAAESSLSLHSDFEKLEDDELQAEAQKVVSLLESGSLLPSAQPDRATSTASDPFSTTWVISSEMIIEPPPPDMSRQDEVEQPVPQKEDEEIDQCETDGCCAPDIDQIIREASVNVQSFAASMQIDGYELSADPSSQVLRDVGSEVDEVDAKEPSSRDIDDDSLDGRDDRDYKQKRSGDKKAEGVLVPAEIHTQDVDADSLQDSESASRSGALDTDSLQDQDSVMAISAESFEFDQPIEPCPQTGEPDQEVPESETAAEGELIAAQKPDDPMQASADSLEDVNMHRSVDSDSIMQKSVDSDGAMQRSADSLNVEASCQMVQSVSSTGIMTDSLERHIPSSVSRDSLEQDATMTTSVDSLEMPLRDRRLADVMMASTESGSWSQTSSGFSSETLKSSGTETEDIMQVSSDCPDFGRPDTDTDIRQEKDDIYTTDSVVYPADTNIAFATLDSEGNLPTDSAGQMIVDSEGNMREQTETTAARPTFIEGACFEQYESDTVTLAEASAMFRRESVPSREDSDMTDCFRETRLQPSSSLTSPSTESSHSDNCYCGPTQDATASQLLQDDLVTPASPRGSRLTVLGVPSLSAWSLPQSSSQCMQTRTQPSCCHLLISSQFHFRFRNASVVLAFSFPFVLQGVHCCCGFMADTVYVTLITLENCIFVAVPTSNCVTLV